MLTPTDDGRWVSEEFEMLARMVQDYDPQFELRWIPPEARSTQEDRKRPYVIWDTKINKAIMFVSETETPVDVMERMFLGDTSKGDVLKRIDARNKAVEAVEMKKALDLAEERQEYVQFLIGTKKNYITLPGGRKVDDQLRPIL